MPWRTSTCLLLLYSRRAYILVDKKDPTDKYVISSIVVGQGIGVPVMERVIGVEGDALGCCVTQCDVPLNKNLNAR